MEKINLKTILYRADLKIVHALSTTLLAFIAAVFEGISLFLLIPTIKGIFRHLDYTFIKETFPGKILSGLFPNLPLTNSVLFALLISSIFSAVILKNVFAYLASYYSVRKARLFSSNLRQLIFSRYLSFGKLFFDRANQGRLTDITTNIIGQIAGQLYRLESGLLNIVFLVLYTCALLILSWQLTLIMLIFFPAAYGILRVIIAKIKKSSRVSVAANRELAERLFNALSCISLIKVYSHEEAEKNEFSRLCKRAAQAELSIDKKWLLLGPLQEVAATIGIVMLIFATALLVKSKAATNLEMFLIYFFIIKKMVSAMRPVSEAWGVLASLKGQFNEITALFDDDNKFFVISGNREFAGLNTAIEIRDLNFSYLKNTPVLSGITLTVTKGTTVAIVGPTGTGKTTLINTLMRFYDCSPSSIFIDGIDIREFSLHTLMRHFALVSQDTLLFNDTLRTNIVYGLTRKVSDEEIAAVCRKAKLEEFLAGLPLGLNTFIGDKGTRLSGGERQRVSIARALLKGAEVMVLDEATSSLDSKTEARIQEAISEAIKDKTVIVIAHRLSTIKNAHKIVVIENGKLVEEGTLDELLGKRGRFFSYWEAQKFY